MSDSTVQPIQSTVSHSKYFKIDVLDIEVSAGPGVINREFVEVLRSVEYSFDDARHMFDGRKAENIRIQFIKNIRKAFAHNRAKAIHIPGN